MVPTGSHIAQNSNHFASDSWILPILQAGSMRNLAAARCVSASEKHAIDGRRCDSPGAEPAWRCHSPRPARRSPPSL